jgi:hypothetical protein
MRRVLLAVLTVILAALVFTTWFEANLTAPPIDARIESSCTDAMRRPPDLTWSAPDRERRFRTVGIPNVPFDLLFLHHERMVRVIGVLHVEFEWVALYRSRAAMDAAPFHAIGLLLGHLWPGEPYWRDPGPSITDRCAIVEGYYRSHTPNPRGASDPTGALTGTIDDVVRLEVWSSPHRAFVAFPPPAR